MKRLAAIATLSLTALALSSGVARAEDDDGGAELLRGPRLALLPSLGIGMGTFVSPANHLPSFVALSVLDLEVVYDTGDRWGFFFRGGFYSAGEDGRWVSPNLTLGASYRLFGDGELVPGVSSAAA